MTDSDRALQRLLDLEAIRLLRPRYCRFMDAEDWAGLRALFADDATFDSEGRLTDSPEVFLERIVRGRTLFKWRSVHQVHSPEITFTGPDTAHGIWAMNDYVDRIWFEGDRREAWAGYGHYEDDYVRNGDTWKISRMRLSRIRVDHLDRATLPPFPDREGPPQTSSGPVGAQQTDM